MMQCIGRHMARRASLVAVPLAMTLAWLWLALVSATAHAHELQPGFLDLRETAPGSYEVVWKQPLSLGQPLRLVPVFPARCHAQAEAVAEMLPQSWVYRTRIACADGLAGQSLTIEGLEAFSTDVLVRVAHADGRLETHLLKPDSPQVQLRPAGAGGGSAFFLLGIEHIALGVDHLLFVLGLLLIVQSRSMLVKTITSFTIAHSLTLGLATLTAIHVPSAPLNACIALSILFLAPEVLRVRRGDTSLTIRHPWLVAFLFGLLHGFGFASGLATLGLPQQEIPQALLYFNVGVEAGQLSFVALVFALRWAWRGLQVDWSPRARAVPVYVLGSLGALWSIERVAVLLSAVPS